MSDVLQDAFDWVDSGPTVVGAKHINALAKAARKWADLHKEINLGRLSDGLRFAHITDSDGEYLIHVAQQILNVLVEP